MYITSQHRSTAQTTPTADPTFGVTVALALAPLATFVALSYAAFAAVFAVGALTTLTVSFVRRRGSEATRRRESAFDRATRA